MTLLRLIADDLTGALDSAAQFTGSHGPLTVLTGPAVPQPEGSFILNLSCRDGALETAVTLARATRCAFTGADVAFKKIDSLVRGHWAAELAATLEVGAFDRVILAPAFPAHGRFTIDGRQIVRRGDEPIETIGVLREALAPFWHATRTAEANATVACEPVMIIPDIASDADLSALVARHRQAPRTLWCGAAGLAQALAGVPAHHVMTGTTPHLVLIGSYHAVTGRQVGRFTQATGTDIVRFGPDGAAAAVAIADRLAAEGVCVALPDLDNDVTAVSAARLIDGWLSDLLPRLNQPERLTVVGGETFAALCRHVGAANLSVEGECEPGVPASRMETGRWAGTLCFSKSGAFGDVEWLSRQTAAARRI